MDISNLEVIAANSGLLPPTAADLMTMIENGESAEMLARIQTLGQSDYVTVLRAVRRLEEALSNYAQAWQSAEYWGAGQPFPDEQEAEAKAAGAEKTERPALQAA